jgi:hypothetical protein
MIPFLPYRSFLVAASLLGALPAQQNIVYAPDSAPTGLRNAFPFGASRGVRQQVLVPGSTLGTPNIIQDIFVAHMGPSATSPLTSGEIVYGDYEINMSVVQTSTLSNIWTQNLPNPTQVQKGRLRMRWQSGAWTPIGLQRPFVWIPLSPNDNLVVDFILWSTLDPGGIPVPSNGYIMNTAADANVVRNWLLNWPSSQGNATVGTGGTKLAFLMGDGNFVGRGVGCPMSTNTAPTTAIAPGTWPRIGQPMTLTLSQAAPSSIATPLIGLSETSFGAIPLPVDLAFLGSSGCNLWIDPLAFLPVTLVNAAGQASFVLPLPNDPSLLTARVYQSWSVFDPAVSRLYTSDYGLMILGQ